MTSKKYSLLLIFLLSTTLLYAQKNRISYSLSHPIKFGAENKSLKPKIYSSGTDSFKVVAILVQFQEDEDGKTTGNGKFDLSNKYFNPSTGRDTVIDAPPYDSSYFADHLTFLKNYFNKSSKGKANISYDLFGRVINLPNKMEDYSPQRNQSNVKLGNLFQDAWARADSFINFSNYDTSNTSFIIFHAGTGRDVDIAAELGFDPTPFDIPSIYLGLKNLKDFFGPNYNGFQTNDGILIRNSSIIPSTELREIQVGSGNLFVELGINGIMCANFGSYLGLPDLFNTSTGKTTIGRFGLMDGESLFNYGGICPGEPSAWEKIYLGWVNPVVISSGTNTYKIHTSSKNLFRDSTIYKVFISSKEYFLIENKNRDPHNDGQTVYIRNRNFLDSNHFPTDIIDGFYENNNYTSIHLINGNVVDVQTFDWSLPGLIDNNNNNKGGILIWHIDENIINAKLTSNSINNDINHKGIDLEEAKGAQELGVTFQLLGGGTFTANGSYFDYWFNGSHPPSPPGFYKNAFTPTSNPNSLSYSFANNNIFITEFSAIDTLMSFKVSVGNIQISPINSFPKFVGVDTSGNSHAIAFDLLGNNSEEIFANSNNNVYGFRSDGSGIVNSSGLLLANCGKYIPSFISTANAKYLVGIQDFGLCFFTDTAVQTLVSWNNSPSSCPPFVNDVTDFVYVGKSNGKIDKYNINLLGVNVDSATNSIKQFSKTSQDTFTYITNINKFLVTGNISTPTSTDVLIVNNSNELFLNGVKLNLNYSVSSITSSPILADVNSDGKQEIIFVADNKVFVLNSNGVLLDNFPVNFNTEISSGISVADINNDNVFDLIFAAKNGDLYAYGVNGIIVSGFPIKIGPNTFSTPALVNLNDTLGIAIISGDGYLYGFKTNNIYNENKVLWKNYLKDKYLSNNNFFSGNSPVNYSEKLPSDRIYNWPNPVYDNQTFIRYYLNGNTSSVNIKILDLSGELITTLTGTAFSQSDNEVIWDVSNVQSGVYYGVVEADMDGNKETKIIKIAVVK